MPNRFRIVPKLGSPIDWDVHAPWSPDLPPDARYYGEVLREVDRRLPEAGLSFVMTWDVDRLPETGKGVVALLLGDEHCQIPRYANEVLAILKQYGTRLAWPWPAGTFGGGLQARDAMKHASLVLERALRARGLPKLREPESILTVPLGYYNQLDLPHVPMADREIDVYFAGDLGQDSFTLSPKTYARTNLMRRAVDRLRERRPDLRIETSSTSSGQGHALGPEAYSQKMAGARISLCPRGSNLETWRMFESARAGCAVVHEALPPHDFYREFPGLLTRTWSDLESLVDDALRDAEATGERTRAWWRQWASEAALADSVVGHLEARLRS